MTAQNRRVRLALDRTAAIEGKRQAFELAERYGAKIPADVLATARSAFEEAARRAVADCGVPGDAEALVMQLLDLRDSAFAIELRRQRRASGARRS